MSDSFPTCLPRDLALPGLTVSYFGANGKLRYSALQGDHKVVKSRHCERSEAISRLRGRLLRPKKMGLAMTSTGFRYLSRDFVTAVFGNSASGDAELSAHILAQMAGGMKSGMWKNFIPHSTFRIPNSALQRGVRPLQTYCLMSHFS